MSEPGAARTPRPAQATLMAVMIILGSLAMLVFAFQEKAGIGSLETQEAIASMLKDEPLASSGLDVDDLQAVLHVLTFVAGAAAVIAGILGQQILTGSRSARLVLTFLVPVHLTAGMVIAGLAAGVVAGASLLLWTEPARSWLAGRPIPDRFLPPSARAKPDDASSAAQHVSTPSVRSGPAAAVSTLAPAAPPGVAPAAPRPRPVTTACVIAFVCSGITALLALAYLAFVAVNAEEYGEDGVAQIEEMLGESPYSADALVIVSLVLIGGILLWSILTAVAAVFALQGRGWARVLLIIGAVGSVLANLLFVLLIVPLLIVAAWIACIVFLSKGESARWFAHSTQVRRAARSAGR